MIKSLAATSALALVLAATPALATPMCHGGGFEYGGYIGFNGNSILGGPDPDEDAFNEEDRAEIDELRLRSVGIDTNRVERWNGCLRAFTPDGMRFFDPGTLQEVF